MRRLHWALAELMAGEQGPGVHMYVGGWPCSLGCSANLHGDLGQVALPCALISLTETQLMQCFIAGLCG